MYQVFSFRPAILLWVGLLLIGTPVAAAGAEPEGVSKSEAALPQKDEDLLQMVEAASANFQPLTEERFAPIRNALRDRARELEQRLGVDTPFAQAWKRYLKWELLEPHFADDAKIDRQSLENLDGVLKRFRSNHPGLELPVFTRTADALERYRELVFWYALAKKRDTRPLFENYLKGLRKQLTRHLEAPTVETARQVGKMLGLVEDLSHSPKLVQAVRSRFSQPNVFAEASETVINRLAQRPVNQSQTVRDVVLGACIRGTAETSGLLSFETVPAEDHIEFEVQLAGKILSDTVGHKKPVRIASRGQTSFVAKKRVMISDEQFQTIPAVASASTKTTIYSVQKTGGRFGRRLIERIAWKKVYQSKSHAEHVAARHAEQKVSAKFDKEILYVISEARQNYDHKLRPPLVRIGQFPAYLRMASTGNTVNVEATLATHQQVSTGSQPPETSAENDLTMRLHETAVNNFLPTIMAGASIRQDAKDQPSQLEGDIPAWVKKLSLGPTDEQPAPTSANPSPANASPTAEDHGTKQQQAPTFKPWYLRLNKKHPASVSFDDQKLTVRLRIAELQAAAEEEAEPFKNWDFIVTYQVLRSDNGILLRRSGDIEALPTGFDPRWDKKLSSEQVGIRNNLAKNLNKRAQAGEGFPQEISIPPVRLPDTDGKEHPLVVRQLDCDNGWLTVGYALP